MPNEIDDISIKFKSDLSEIERDLNNLPDTAESTGAESGRTFKESFVKSFSDIGSKIAQFLSPRNLLDKIESFSNIGQNLGSKFVAGFTAVASLLKFAAIANSIKNVFLDTFKGSGQSIADLISPQPAADKLKTLGELGGVVGKNFSGAFIKNAASLISKFAAVYIFKKVFDVLSSFGGAMIDAARATDILNRNVEKTFGNSLPKLNEAVNKTARSVGLTDNQFKELALSSTVALQNLGATSEQMVEMSSNLVITAASLKDYNNDSRSTAEITNVLSDALTGNLTGLKSLGIALTEYDIEAELVRTGKSKLTGQTLELARAMATENLIMTQASNAVYNLQNNFTSIDLKMANLSAGFSNLKESVSASIGRFLTPIVEELLDVTLESIDAISGYRTQTEKLNNTLDHSIRTLPGLVSEREKLLKIENKSARETEKLNSINEALIKISKETGIQIFDENGKFVGLTNAVINLKKAKSDLAEQDKANLKLKQQEILANIQIEGQMLGQELLARQKEAVSFRPNEAGWENLRKIQEKTTDSLHDQSNTIKTGNAALDLTIERVKDLNKRRQDALSILAKINNVTTQTATTVKGTSGVLSNTNDEMEQITFHLDNFEQSLLSLNDEYEEFLTQTKQLTDEKERQSVLAEGELRFLERQNVLIKGQRDIIDKALKDELSIKIRAIDENQRKANLALDDMLSASIENEREIAFQRIEQQGVTDSESLTITLDFLDRKEELEKEHQNIITEIILNAERDRQEARAEIIKKELEEITNIITNLTDIATGKLDKKLQGVGNLVSAISPEIGAAISGVGKIAGLFAGLFEGEKNHKKEIETIEQKELKLLELLRAKQSAILDLIQKQVDLQRQLAMIAGEAEQTEKKIFENNIRTIQLTERDPVKASALVQRAQEERFARLQESQFTARGNLSGFYATRDIKEQAAGALTPLLSSATEREDFLKKAFEQLAQSATDKSTYESAIAIFQQLMDIDYTDLQERQKGRNYLIWLTSHLEKTVAGRKLLATNEFSQFRNSTLDVIKFSTDESAAGQMTFLKSQERQQMAAAEISNRMTVISESVKNRESEITESVELLESLLVAQEAVDAEQKQRTSADLANLEKDRLEKARRIQEMTTRTQAVEISTAPKLESVSIDERTRIQGQLDASQLARLKSDFVAIANLIGAGQFATIDDVIKSIQPIRDVIEAGSPEQKQVFDDLIRINTEIRNYNKDFVDLSTVILDTAQKQLDTTIELGKERQLSFIDIGRGGYSLGNVFQNKLQTVNPGSLSLPTATIGNTAAGMQERQTTSLETLVEIQRDSRLLLMKILTAISKSGNFDDNVLRALNNISGQSIGGYF